MEERDSFRLIDLVPTIWAGSIRQMDESNNGKLDVCRQRRGGALYKYPGKEEDMEIWI